MNNDPNDDDDDSLLSCPCPSIRHHQIRSRREIPPGSEIEVEIRAATVEAVSRLEKALADRIASEDSQGPHGLLLDGAPHGQKQQQRSLESGGVNMPSSSTADQLPLDVVHDDKSCTERRMSPYAVQLDWWLWHQGERDRKQHPPHHRTLTVFY